MFMIFADVGAEGRGGEGLIVVPPRCFHECRGVNKQSPEIALDYRGVPPAFGRLIAGCAYYSPRVHRGEA